MIDDLEDLAHRLEGWLLARHPERAPLAVSQLKRSDAGYSNITVLGDLRWQHDGAAHSLPIVLRVQPQTSSVYPDCDIVRQYRVMQALAGSAVPVPRLLGLETDPAALGAPFFLMQRIEGRVPNENPLYHLEGWFHDLDTGALRQHWFNGIDTVAAIARLDWRALGLDFLQPPPGRTPLAHQLAYYRDAVAWAERLGRPYPHLHAAFDWLHAHQPADEPVALSWADAKLGNCVYRDGRVVGALDWEQATLANPVDDLAWWLMLDESMSTGYGVPRLPGLPSRDETVAHWQRASGFSARDLAYYDVYAAWRMAYVMARIGTVFMQRGLVPRESEMDLRNGGSTLLALHAARLGF
ncbi:MAG TPA: phosphotransferase family protein [Rubrivivax sp.]|nr:phosphotransferase family protein [Rubrivivax sp.]HPO19443.1 phosphotransferase family protein [Rubrivivax sp.]